MSREKIVDKIKKLLALGQGKANQAESELAMLKAQELLLNYGLTLKEVSDSDEPYEKEVSKSRVKKSTRGFPGWKIRIALVICPNFRVSLVLQKGWHGQKDLILIGLKEDVEVCQEVLPFAFTIFNECFHTFLKKWKDEHLLINESRSISLRVRNDYVEGFVSGLADKFRKQVKEKALIIVQDALVEKALRSSVSGSSTVSGGIGFGDRGAYVQGYQDSEMVQKDSFIKE